MRFTYRLEIFEIELERAFGSLAACQSRLPIIRTRVNVHGNRSRVSIPNRPTTLGI